MSNLRKFFDYNSLPDNATRATLRQEATAIKLAVKRTHDNIIEIGNRLIHAKEVAGHGKFAEWIEAEFQMSDRHARNFMNVAETFGKSEIISDLNIPNTALFMLSAPSISDETRSVALELAASGDLKTTRDVKELIEVAKPILPHQQSNAESAAQYEQEQVNAYNSEDDDLGLDPFADEPDESLANIAAIEAEENPIQDEPVVEDMPVVTTTIDTLSAVEAKREESAQQEAQNPDELDDARWMFTLPAYEVLQKTGNRGILFKRAALDYRALQKTLTQLQRGLSQTQSLQMADGSPFSKVLSPLASLKHPRYWRICGGCKGEGCLRCNSTGYDLAAGIDPASLLEKAGDGE